MNPTKPILAIALCLLLCSPSFAAGPFRRMGHNAMVAASGIRPNQVGRYEGVGMSTRGFIEARNNACYWGQKTPVSVQYNKVGNRYYAVVRYR